LAFSFLRLADARLKSGGFWLIRGRIKGIDAFRAASASLEPGDLSLYDKGCEGLEIVDERTLIIHLVEPDPRFPYALAMPYLSAVSRRAVEFFGPSSATIRRGPAPSSSRNGARTTPSASSATPIPQGAFPDDGEPLPLLDRAVCYLVKQPIASWLMFLQDSRLLRSRQRQLQRRRGRGYEAGPALAKRGISLLKAPQFETNYIGFNMADPVLGSNEKLRQALCLSFDKRLRERQSNGRLIPAYGPIPPGYPGALSEADAPYGSYDLERAKRLLAEAGYPGGIDPKTGKPLELSFDQAGSETFFRQVAEVLSIELRKIGLELKPKFSNRPRFIQKLNQGRSSSSASPGRATIRIPRTSSSYSTVRTPAPATG
jgi:ABC-type transport system substrate-binding protein